MCYISYLQCSHISFWKHFPGGMHELGASLCTVSRSTDHGNFHLVGLLREFYSSMFCFCCFLLFWDYENLLLQNHFTGPFRHGFTLTRTTNMIDIYIVTPIMVVDLAYICTNTILLIKPSHCALQTSKWVELL